ncbi:MAG: hypothetical protein SGPRY_005046, partial [Prymnesium sp.]
MGAKPVSSFPSDEGMKPAAPKAKPPQPNRQASRERGAQAAASGGLVGGGGGCGKEDKLGETPPCGTPFDEFGEGWIRVSKRRSSDPTGRHLDHTWISPEGVRFTSRVKALRYLSDGASSAGTRERKRPEPIKPERAASSHEEREEGTWVACDRCGKWREVTDRCLPLPEVWYCELNPVVKYSSCDAPEQEWDEADEWVEATTDPLPIRASPKPSPHTIHDPPAAETPRETDPRPSTCAPPTTDARPALCDEGSAAQPRLCVGGEGRGEGSDELDSESSQTTPLQFILTTSNQQART